MNEEVEIKVILKNPEQVEKKLNESAKFIEEKKQKDEYFSPEEKDFFYEKPTREYLRIRTVKGKSELDYHFCHFGDDGSLLKTDEYETEIENPEMMEEILKKIGMVSKVTVTKHRKCFEYKEYEILIDHIEELGYFIEIEAKNVKGSVEETRKKCFELLEELGAEWKKPPKGGYPDMILRKNATTKTT